jgi:hypothetical protein
MPVQTAFGMDELGKVQQVGETTFAIREGQQVRIQPALAQHLAEHRHETLRMPNFMPSVEGFQLGFEQLRLLVERV